MQHSCPDGYIHITTPPNTAGHHSLPRLGPDLPPERYVRVDLLCARVSTPTPNFPFNIPSTTTTHDNTDSLGGNSRTTVLATVRPGLGFYEESLSTLKYASRARTIVNTCVVVGLCVYVCFIVRRGGGREQRY